MKTRKTFYSSFRIYVEGVVGQKLINSLARKAASLNPLWTKDVCEREVRNWVQAELASLLELELESQIEDRWAEIEGGCLKALQDRGPR